MKGKKKSLAKVMADGFLRGAFAWKARCPRCGRVYARWAHESFDFMCPCGYFMNTADFHKN